LKKIASDKRSSLFGGIQRKSFITLKPDVGASNMLVLLKNKILKIKRKKDVLT
jgi:hypothetical protein